MGDRAASPAGHEVHPHTADVIVEAWGDSLGACLSEAVLGLIETYLDDPVPVPTRHLEVEVAASGDLTLLEAALDEVIFTLDTRDQVPVACTVTTEAGRATMQLGMANRSEVTGTGSVPKAISRSGMTLHRDSGGVRCSFIVDV